MGSLVNMNLFGNIYEDKKVFITGHTGFKGSWLSLWLNQLNAKVTGYSLEPPTDPNHHELLNLNIDSNINDIRDLSSLTKALKKSRAEIVFHLAAQPLVKESYANPIFTYETNVIGTLNVLEACKNVPSVKAIVIITTDKCYENVEKEEGYKESDRLGGYDPYSSSKACAEILVSSYRSSYFNLNEFKKEHSTLVATARAGNIIGGGDWAKDRLIPDVIKSTINRQTTHIRNPYYVRPWQYVLDPLSGYLLLGWKLMEGKKEFACAWNFGPEEQDFKTVEQVVKNAQEHWSDIQYETPKTNIKFHETKILKLDCTKAKNNLKWQNITNFKETLGNTIRWYKNYYNSNQIESQNGLVSYVNIAIRRKAIWTLNN